MQQHSHPPQEAVNCGSEFMKCWDLCLILLLFLICNDIALSTTQHPIPQCGPATCSSTNSSYNCICLYQFSIKERYCFGTTYTVIKEAWRQAHQHKNHLLIHLEARGVKFTCRAPTNGLHLKQSSPRISTMLCCKLNFLHSLQFTIVVSCP